MDPKAFTINCEGVAPVLDEAFVARCKKIYSEHQMLLIKNTGISELAPLKKYIDTVLEDTMLYEGGANSRGSLEPYFYETGAPKQASLHYHHEMAYVGKSTS